MANFAELNETNETINVIVVAPEDFSVDGVENEEAAKDLLEGMYGHRRWVQTSYTGSIRGRYASIGSTYNEELDQFIEVKPFDSWVLNTTTGEWEAPSPMPASTSSDYPYWDEETVSWKTITVKYPEPGDKDYEEVVTP